MAEGEGMMPMPGLLAAALLALAVPATASVTVGPTTLAGAAPLALRIGGRVQPAPAGYRRQWPGSYFEARFQGPAVLMRVGPGDAIFRVSVDGAPVATLVKPAAGTYRVDGLPAGAHLIRVDVATESQAGPTVFGGFYAPPGTALPAPPAHVRQIEFIGDSHTVGYGNLSAKRECSEAEVWATTDTSQAMPARLARHYDADYQVNAISGRGIVRNYAGMAADTIPRAYPFTLFDGKTRADDPAWRPQLIVIALGTNDFSTALHAGERWTSRAALRADYEADYVGFVQRLRARNPHARILLWATGLADGEIARAVAGVAARLNAEGDKDVLFVPVYDLEFSGCHAHPSLTDDRRIAATLAAAIDAHPMSWPDP
jgi:lysophospholipase L1-like esterase